MGGRRDQLDLVAGTKYDEAGGGARLAAPAGVEAQRGSDALRDQRRNASQRGDLLGDEVRLIVAAGEMDRAPHRPRLTNAARSS